MPKARDNENPLPPVREMQAPALFGVQGKVVLVTGGGSGIGAMIAAGFCANGATVIVSSRKDTTPFCDELTARGPGKAYCLQADVGKPEVACYPLSSCCITPPRAAIAGRGPARGRGQTSRGQAACVGEQQRYHLVRVDRELSDRRFRQGPRLLFSLLPRTQLRVTSSLS